VSDLNSRRVGDANFPTTWSHPDSSEPATKGQNSFLIVGDRTGQNSEHRVSQA